MVQAKYSKSKSMAPTVSVVLFMGIYFLGTGKLSGNLRYNVLLFIAFVSIAFLYTLTNNLKYRKKIVPYRLCFFIIMMSYSFITSMWSINSNVTLVAAVKFFFPTIAIYYSSYYLTKKLGFYRFISIGTNTILFMVLLSIPFTIQSVVGRFEGLFGNSNQMGLFLSLICLPQFVIDIYTGFKKSGKRWYLGRIIIGVALILSTFSRSSIFMLIIGIISSVFMYKVKYKQNFKVLLDKFMKFTIVIISLALGWLIIFFRGLSIGSRLELLMLGMNLISFKGYGYGTSAELLSIYGFPWFNSWHNGYLGTLIEGGVVWLMVGILTLYFTVKDGLYIKKHEKLVGIVAISTTFTWALTQLFEFQLLRNSHIFYTYIAFSAAVASVAAQLRLEKRKVNGLNVARKSTMIYKHADY